MKEFLKINGVVMPTPDKGGISLSKELLWSENSGRIPATGLFVGDIIAEKNKVVFTFTNLSSAEVKKIEDAVTSFFDIEFPNPYNLEETIKMNCYKTPRTYVVKYIRGENATFDKLTLSCIEA